MSRLFWILVGVGLTVVVVLRGKELMHRLTPKGVQEQMVAKGHEAAAGFGDFMATFRAAMAQREAELRDELNINAPTH
ncbi:hypothetical protein [Tessaracoccus sp. Z1128]